MSIPASAIRATQKQTHWARLAATLLITLLLGACAGIESAEKMDDLNKTLRGYEKAIRWAQYDAAYSYHKWEGDVQPTIPKDIENFRVTQYETFGEKFSEKDMVMMQTIKLRYYNTETQREKSMQQLQKWKFFPEIKRWYLISEPITFK